jgi:hypothetical protein
MSKLSSNDLWHKTLTLVVLPIEENFSVTSFRCDLGRENGSSFLLVDRALPSPISLSLTTQSEDYTELPPAAVSQCIVKKRSESFLLVPIAFRVHTVIVEELRKQSAHWDLCYSPRNIWRIRTIHTVPHPSLRQVALVYYSIGLIIVSNVFFFYSQFLGETHLTEFARNQEWAVTVEVCYVSFEKCYVCCDYPLTQRLTICT